MTSSASQRGDVVQVDFPYSEGEGAKSRPALVLAGPSAHGDYIVAMMSSQKQDDGVLVDKPDFSSGGLKGASHVRVKRLYTVSGSTFSEKRGSLKPEAMKRVAAELCPAIGCTK